MSRLLITIPTWNEAPVIRQNLEIIKAKCAEVLAGHEVVIEVADNGSTDETITIVQAIDGVRLVELQERGKGKAIRESWLRHLNDAEVLIFMDADLAADLASLPNLVKPILDGKAQLVCGSRFLSGSKVERSLPREVASYGYRLLQRLILNLPVKDAQCGFKAMSVSTAKELLPSLKENNWLFDTELLALAARRGFKILEIPIAWIEHRDPRRRSALKVFKDGWGFVWGLGRIWRRLKLED